MKQKTGVVILAAGEGKRMKSSLPKPLLPLMGKSLLEWILDSVSQVPGLEAPLVVVGKQGQQIQEKLADRNVHFVTQDPPLGTGHAVQVCLPLLRERGIERVLVMNGDMPFISSQSLERLLASSHPGALISFTAESPPDYGRLLFTAEGKLDNIVEVADATAEQLAIKEVNAGFYLFDVSELETSLQTLKTDNNQGEYYLTQVPVTMARQGHEVDVVPLKNPHEGLGANTPQDFSQLVSEAQSLILNEHLNNGVLIDDLATTWIEADVTISPGARIRPFTYITRGVKIGSDCDVGPFAHLREGTVLQAGAEVGNFTEVKQSVLGAHTKAKHLSYIGDARIGDRVNVGAGTVFANYDGRNKHQIEVGDGVFIGSGTVLVAPLKLGTQSSTGAGAIVTARSHVPDNQTVVGVPAKPLKIKGEKKK